MSADVRVLLRIRAVRAATPRRRGASLTRSLVLCLACAGVAAPVRAYEEPKVLPEGWDMKVAFGAEASTGTSRTSSFSLETDTTYRGERFENALQMKLLHSVASLEVAREDEAGKPVLDAQGEPVTRQLQDTTADRRFLHVEPRWYLPNQRNYVFGFLDYDRNRPRGVDSSVRQIGGVGYRLWNDKANYLAMGIGLGHKRLQTTGGEVEDGGIGYFGVRIVLALSRRVKLDAGLDTDFGSDNDYTEFGLALAFRLRRTLALKFGYDARVNSGLDEVERRFEETFDASASVNLELDIL